MNSGSENPKDNPNSQLEQLRAVLLKNDRAEIADLQNLLADKNRLAERVSPIFEERIAEIKTNFPQEFGELVDKAIEVKLKASQEELLNLIFPLLGKMISKYIQQQMEALKDSINTQAEQTFSWKYWKRRLRAAFLGVNDADMVLSNLKLAVIEEIHVIQFNSGISLGNYSRGETIDKDLFAGMFTAIKSFAEDSFAKRSENLAPDDLEQIEYGSYKILIQNFHTYYITFVISGALSSEERNELKAKALDFSDKELRDSQLAASLAANATISEATQTNISTKLKQYFITP